MHIIHSRQLYLKYMENINAHTETINNVNDIVVIESQEGPRTVDSYPTCLSDVAIYWVDLNTRDSSIFVFPKINFFSSQT